MSTLMPSIYARHPSQYPCRLQLAQLPLLVLYDPCILFCAKMASTVLRQIVKFAISRLSANIAVVIIHAPKLLHQTSSST